MLFGGERSFKDPKKALNYWIEADRRRLYSTLLCSYFNGRSANPSSIGQAQDIGLVDGSELASVGILNLKTSREVSLPAQRRQKDELKTIPSPHLITRVLLASLDVPVRLSSRPSQNTANDPNRLGGVRVGSYNEVSEVL